VPKGRRAGGSGPGLRKSVGYCDVVVVVVVVVDEVAPEAESPDMPLSIAAGDVTSVEVSVEVDVSAGFEQAAAVRHKAAAARGRSFELILITGRFLFTKT